jgi:hypothetical protein
LPIRVLKKYRGMVEPVSALNIRCRQGTAGYFFTVGLSGIGRSGPADPRIEDKSSEEPIDASLI